VWCDTEYSFHGGEKMSLREILAGVSEIGCGLVEITGGEPLIQPNAFRLASALIDRGYTVLVETSGAVDVGSLDPRAHKIMDLKCPGSGEASKNLWSNLDHLTARDEVKFVLKDRSDFEWACSVIREHDLDDRIDGRALAAILFSPVWGALELKELAEWTMAEGLPVRLQLQLHKLIWGPDSPGV
jgi:7-carboxy-7-deazaguanine synthase